MLIHPPHTVFIFTNLMTSAPSKIQWLYLVSSGNDDDVYKIGISQHPKVRLEEIKKQYDVPNAEIVEVMDVSTRDDVFAIEQALHSKYSDKRAATYKGREWFVLSKADIAELRKFYQTESDSFAQAQAFYGLIEEVDLLKEKAWELEIERVRQIGHNRRHGKTYDTKVKGELKRYNDLRKKLETGVLAERFEERNHEHPIMQAVHRACNIVEADTARRLSKLWLKLGLGSFVFGVAVSAAPGVLPSDEVAGIAGIAGVAGMIGGAMTTNNRPSSTRKELDLQLTSIANRQYPGCDQLAMIDVYDRKDNVSYLVKTLEETSCKLRQQPLVFPKVNAEPIKAAAKAKAAQPVIPLTACAVVVAITGCMTLASVDYQRQKSSAVEPPPNLAPVYVIK